MKSTTEIGRARTGALRRMWAVGCVLPALLVVSAAEVPARLTNDAFWEIVTTFSEEGGFFASNNWVSNETLYQHVVPRLQATVKPGGVYLGVGPDQNFTYIVGLKPTMAFIVDIRRQNLLHHLLYKGLMEISPTRLEFISRLFGRPVPKGLLKDARIDEIMTAFLAEPTSAALINLTADEVIARLTKVRGFTLTEADRSTLLTVYSAFYSNGPGITYTGTPSLVTTSLGGQLAQYRISPFPGFADLVAMDDGEGVNRGYLASEDSYGQIRAMQLRNAIVPVVGDFAGAKALRAVGKWVNDRGGRITAIYTSNVEQYLFQNRVWREYYDNVAALPLDDTSSFIRSFFGGGTTISIRGGQTFAWRPGSSAPNPYPTFIASSQLTCSVKELLAAVAAGTVVGYHDVIAKSK
jgi:hypothetical protein